MSDQAGLPVAAVADHHGWAVVVTVAPDGTVIDRRRAELIDAALPSSPVEHEAQSLALEQAIALVREVERSVTLHVRALWDALATDHDIAAVAIREIPDLPSEIAERIRSYHAQTRADAALYRRLLADHATQRGWAVHFYDHRHVIDEATRHSTSRRSTSLRPARTSGPRGPSITVAPTPPRSSHNTITPGSCGTRPSVERTAIAARTVAGRALRTPSGGTPSAPPRRVVVARQA